MNEDSRIPGFVRLLWHAVRLPLLTCLIILEPIVRFVLSSLAVLGMLTAVFLEFVVELRDFPFLFVFGGGVACALALLAFYALMRALG